jgi:hypothetical protein
MSDKYPFPVSFLGRFAGQAAPSQGLHDFVAVDPFKDTGWKRELKEGRTSSGRSYEVVNGRFDYAGEDDSHYPLAAYEDRFDTYDEYMGRDNGS